MKERLAGPEPAIMNSYSLNFTDLKSTIIISHYLLKPTQTFKLYFFINF